MASTKNPIEHLSISGFKSIKSLEDFPLTSLNVLIGPNGTGKSNFISYFRMLSEMMGGRLQAWTAKQGSADRILSFGIKETSRLTSEMTFGMNKYRFTLEPTVDAGFTFTDEQVYFEGIRWNETWRSFGTGHVESQLPKQSEKPEHGTGRIANFCFSSISKWKVFHFHDTSDTAGVKRMGALHDNEALRPDASNLAAYLHMLQTEHADTYQEIRKTVQLAIPLFDDFSLKPTELPTGEQQIRLLWRQKNSDYDLWPSQLSDGSIRFICLVTALLQPDPPSTLIIDEPELGLHPYAITLLGSLLRSAAKRMQVIVSTQSVPLVNEFGIEDLIIVERNDGGTIFKRFDEDEFAKWMEDYSVGELWEKNILGGRPRS